MSAPTAREALATAIGTCEGITAHPYVTGNTSPGTAYPRISEVTFPNAFGGVVTWDVVVVLPQDPAAAEKYLDTHAAAWFEALSSQMQIQALRPQRLQLDGVGVLPVVFITGHRAADTPEGA